MSTNQNARRWVSGVALGCVGIVCLCIVSAWFLFGGGIGILSRVARPPAPAPQPKVAISTQNIGPIEELYRLQMGDPVYRVAWLPDSKLLAVSTGQQGTMLRLPNQSFQVWDVTTGSALLSISGQGYERVFFALSPDGQTLAYLDNNTVKLWDVAGRRELRTLVDNSSQRLGYLAFLPDGKTLASIYTIDAVVITWEVATGRELSIRDGLSSPRSRPEDYLVYSPDWTPGGSPPQISHDGKTEIDELDQSKDKFNFMVTDTKSRRVLRTLEGTFDVSYPYGYGSVAFSPDDALVAARGSVWDVQSGKRSVLNGEGYVETAFSPDGRFLAMGSDDGTVQLWGIRP